MLFRHLIKLCYHLSAMSRRFVRVSIYSLRFVLLALIASCLTATTLCQSISKVVVTPASVVGGTSLSGTVTLSSKAATGGTLVSLSTSNSLASVPASITIPKGAMSATFSVKTVAVGGDCNEVVKATHSESSATASFVIKAPTLTSFMLSPTQVTGGTSTVATVKVTSKAPVGGLTMLLTSSHIAALPPSTIKIPEGATTGTATIPTKGVTGTATAVIGLKFGLVTKTTNLTIVHANVSGLSLHPATVVGGAPAIGTVTINGLAPASGFVVTLTSNNKSATVPATVTIAAGAANADFTVSTLAITSKLTVTIAAVGGGKSVTAALAVTPAPPSKFAGTYIGSFYTTSPDLGSVALKVDTAGKLDGTATDAINAKVSTLSGNVANNGYLTITVNNNGSIETSYGAFSFNSKGYLIGDIHPSDGSTVTLTLAGSGKTSPFPGNYTGTFMSSDGGTGTVKLTCVASGAITGTALSTDGTSKLTGSISPYGVVRISASSAGHTDNNAGGGSFNSGGKLIIIVKSADNMSTTTVTLSKAL